MTKTTPLFICLLLLNFVTAGQTLSPSPWINSDQKQKQTNGSDLISVDPYTGSGQLNVPIYSYALNGVDVGISLGYTMNGLQVDRIASNVGFGFEMNTGGEIRRQVRGNPDDVYNPGCKVGILFHSKAWVPSATGAWYNYDMDEPDIFYVMIGSRNLKFMISRTGKVITIPKADIKVERLINGQIMNGSLDTGSRHDGSGLSFNIIDESGNKFYFRKNIQKTITDTSNKTQVNAYCTTTTHPIEQWALDKIISYEGDQIDYEYTSQSVRRLENISQTFRENGTSGTVQKKENETFSLLRLNAIRFPNNVKAEFVYDNTISRCDLPGDKRLTGIKISETEAVNGTSPKQYAYLFEQAYFVSLAFLQPVNCSDYLGMRPSLVSEVALPTTHCYEYSGNRLRLKLKSITYQGSNNASKKLYTFDYNPVPLPERIKGGRDRYGYNNGQDPALYSNGGVSEYLQISRHLLGTSYVGMDLTPTTEICKTSAWCIRKITNQTNGSVEIKYGLNADLNNNYGGVRIDSILCHNGLKAEDNIIKTYRYRDLEWYGEEGEKHYPFVVFDPSVCIDISGNGGSSTQFEVYSNSCVTINQAINRSNIGYKNVDEYIYNASGELQQKKSTEFSGLLENTFQSNGNQLGVPPYSNKQYIREWGLGLPKSISVFDNNDRIKERKAYTFQVADDLSYQNNQDFKCYATLPKTQGCYGAVSGFFTDAYYPFTGTTKVASLKTRTYVSDTDYLEELETYEYDRKNNLLSTSSTNSKGQTEKEYLYYNYNWLTPGFNSGLNPGSAVTKLNADSLQKLIYKINTRFINGTERIIGLQASGLVNVQGNIIREKFGYRYKSKNPVPFQNFTLDYASLCNGNAVAGLIKTLEIRKFDDRGFAIETYSTLTNETNASIFDQVSGEDLAIASNTTYGEFGYCGFESKYKGSGQDYNKGNFDFNLNGITAQYKFLGRCCYHLTASSGLWTNTNLIVGQRYVISYWEMNGGNVSVNDGTNQIHLSQVATLGNWNLHQKEFVATASRIGFWGEGYLDELRIQPVNAVMSNKNHLPLTGTTSEVEGNNRIASFEFDDLGNSTIKRDHKGHILSKSSYIIQGND